MNFAADTLDEEMLSCINVRQLDQELDSNLKRMIISQNQPIYNIKYLEK